MVRKHRFPSWLGSGHGLEEPPLLPPGVRTPHAVLGLVHMAPGSDANRGCECWKGRVIQVSWVCNRVPGGGGAVPSEGRLSTGVQVTPDLTLPTPRLVEVPLSVSQPSHSHSILK